MKLLIKSAAIVTLFLLSSCDMGDFGNINIDPKRPLKVEPEFLFNGAVLAIANQVTTTGVGRLLPQYWSNTIYTPDSRYVGFKDGEASGSFWDGFYRDALLNLSKAKELVPAYEGIEAVRKNKEAQITVLEVYVFQMLVDAFGDVPYSDALKGNAPMTPAYDDAQTIYTDLASKLNGAIADLKANPSAGGFNDPIYGGEISLWLRFANSLKIKIALRAADVPGFNSQQWVEEAYAGSFSSANDDAKLYYPGGSWSNPVFSELVLSGRPPDFAPSNTLVDYMNVLNDPRRPFFMKNEVGKFKGIPYGLIGSSDPSQFSRLPDLIESERYFANLMDYTETLFYLSEAALRGWKVGMNGEEYYNLAVTRSIRDWGGTSEDAQSYLAQPSVAFSTSEGGNHLFAIGKQKWLALYNRGWEGWAEWRRFDYPVLNAPENMQVSDIPVRFTYPRSERIFNKKMWEQAALNIAGDSPSKKVFWDVN